MRKFIFIAFSIFFIFSVEANASCPMFTICGSTSVAAGNSATYMVTDDAVYTTYSFTVVGGTVTSTSRSNMTYTVVITWNVVGTGTITFDQGGEHLNVTVTCGAPTTPNATFTYTNNCGNTVITSTGTPPSGTTWYWQTTSTGTSTANSTPTYTVTANGTYYLRPSNCGGWGTAQATSAVTVKVIPTVTASNQSICGGTTTSIALTNNAASTLNTWTVAQSNVSGASNSRGTSGTTSPYTYTLFQLLSATTNTAGTATYTVTPSLNGCTGTPLAVTATVKPLPTVSATPTSQTRCSAQTTAISITNTNNVTGTTYSWFPSTVGNTVGGSTVSNTSATSINDVIQLVNGNTTGIVVYSITGTANGCTGASFGASVNVNPKPVVPTVPNATSNTCGPQTLSYNGTPASGTSWYWQGTNSSGQDYQSGTATAATYSAGVNGTNNYYIASRNTYGCWSASTSRSVPVNIPPAPMAQGTPPSFCEWDVTSLTVTPSNPYDYSNSNWYSSSNTFLAAGTTYTPTNLNFGTYTYNVTNVDTLGCESISVPYTLVVNANCDQYMNWQESISYNYSSSDDATRSIISDSRVYADGFGKGIQSQSKSNVNNLVFANESVYDKLGNQTLTTMSAPINSSSFVYRYRFNTNNTGQKYSWNDFDKPIATNAAGEVNNPIAVGNNGLGTLGWYYSSANTLEPSTATTSFPYSRSYTPAGPNPVTSNSSAPGDVYKMGGGHQTQTDKILITSTELNHYYSLKPYFTSNSHYWKAIDISDVPSNAQSFNTYLSVSSHIVANLLRVDCQQSTGNPGIYPIGTALTVTPGTICTFNVNGYATGSGTAKLHVTDGSGNDILWGSIIPSGAMPVLVTSQFTIPAGVTSIKVGVQWSAANTAGSFYISSVSLVENTAAPLGNPGYKIISTDADGKRAATFTDADGNTVASAVVTSAVGVTPVAYDNTTWSYNYYNNQGQLVASVAPKGVNTTDSSMPTFLTKYKYDHLGRLISTKSPDEGVSLFVYSTDGKIRFSQNQEQRNPTNNKRFSYTNYDYLGRLIESGEYTFSATGDFAFDSTDVATPAANSVLNYIDNIGYTSVTRRGNNATATRYSDTTFIDYDVPVGFTSDGIHTAQNNLTGRVSRTKNGNATTWYSYDEFGQVEWTMQKITGLGNKTVDYTYDFLGNVIQVAYQKGQSDAFYHHYTYNADNQLVNVTTSTDGNPLGSTALVQAKYYYYLQGPLKRVELGNKVQGIDYVYNINGSLKAINHADPSQDPGADGLSGTNVTFMKDAFGMALDYYTNDYTPATTNTLGSLNPSGTSNQYGGLIKSQRWHSQVDNHQQNAYAYNYDNLNRFSAANFGAVSGSSGSYSFTTSAIQQYKESVSGFDNNGNIGSLSRNNKKGTSGGNSAYIYNYASGKNQLSSITGSTTVNYVYNTIGQMTQQTEGTNVMNVTYNAYGLTKEVRDGSNNLQEQYFYDDRGDLVKKLTPLPAALGTGFKTTYYVHDATGNILAVYEQNGNNALSLVEQPIYGAGRIGMMKPRSGQKKYFYEVNDHLGNVRAVIGAASTDAPVATYENATDANFLRYDNARRINATLFNHTSSGSYSERLNAITNEKYGIARSLSMMPGDTVKLEVYAKYVDTNSANWTGALNTLMGQIAANTSGVVIDGANYSSSTSSFPFPTSLDKSASTGTGPKAYLNWLIFDRNFVLTNGGYQRLSSTPREYGQNCAHEKLSTVFTVNEPSYVYAYLSNENDTPVEVYFDDFKVTQVHSPIVAGGDYYPYGLTISERQITQERYRFGYQGQFSEYDSLTKTNTFQLRRYDARFGRWLSPDPKGQYASPYIGMGNNPVGGVDKDGGFFEALEDWFVNEAGKAAWFETAEEATAAGFTKWLGDASYIFDGPIGDAVTVATKRMTAGEAAMYDAIVYWNKLGGTGTFAYSLARYGDGTANNPFRFNYDDKGADCVETILAPMKERDKEWYNIMTEKANSQGDRNANVDVMRKGLKNVGLVPEIRTPKVGDLAFWDGHVARVYSVHGDNFAIWTSVSGNAKKGIPGKTPVISGLSGNSPFYNVENLNQMWGTGSGKFQGFVTLYPR